MRWRVAVAFALAALLVTGLLALVTWNLASNFMLDQREQGAAGQFSTNARLIEAYLRRHPAATDPARSTALAQALPQLEYDQDDTVGLRVAGRWVADGPLSDSAILSRVADESAGMAGSATPGIPATAQTRTVAHVVGGRPVLVTAAAVPGQDAAYVELSALSDLDQALRYVRSVLLAGVGASLLFGLMLGRWAARQALRPLTELTRAAGRVAGGDLRARLPEQGDADLASLAAIFNQTTAALEQRVVRDTRFAGDVSHELRSPLTTMINAASVLNRRRDEFSLTGQHALALLTTDIHRFQQMVIDLLEISQGSQTEKDDMEPCDLVELADHTLRARHHPLPLDAGEPAPVVVRADRRRLERVITNLLDNATRHGGGAIRVGVGHHDGMARLEVDDAGPGIPVGLRSQVFERFTRGERSGDRGDDTGSGLGLALAAQHVRSHRGTVWVEDRPGGGSRFVVELPIASSW